MTTLANSINPDVEQPWDVQALFAVPVVPVFGPSRFDTLRATAASIDTQRLSHRTLGGLVVGLDSRKGIAPTPNDYPTLIRSTVGARMPTTWEEIGAVRVGDIRAWPSVGTGKVVELLAFLADCVGPPMPGAPWTEAPNSFPIGNLVEALRTIAAWGVSSGIDDLSTAIRLANSHGSDRPRAAIQALYGVELDALAGDRLKWWDADLGARDLLSRFDERDLVILEARVLHGAHRAQRTLEDLGSEFGVTRERVRQLEHSATSKLDRLLGYDRYRSIHRAASRARNRLGTACPASEAESVVHEDVNSLADELLLWVAGPYHRSGGWVIDDEYQSVADLMRRSFDDVSEDNLAYQDDLFAAAVDRGLNPQYFDQAIADSPEIELLGHRFVVWPSGTARRAQTMLAASGVPMTSEDMFKQEPRVENFNSYRNALHSSDNLVKVGVGRWGLVEWGSEEYPGTVPAMVREIQHTGSMEIDVLAADLAHRFGVSEASVSIQASMHPAFIREGGTVRLRTDAEPYLPKTDLGNTAGCFQIDGAWAYRIRVDRDILRGSGRSIPEAFASHLGVGPLQKGRLAGPKAPLSVGWGQYPAMGSIRLNVEALGLGDGDYAFIRRSTPDAVDFLGVTKAELSTAGAAGRIRLLVGADALSDESIETTLARALGIGSAAKPTRNALVGRLVHRGDEDLADHVRAMR